MIIQLISSSRPCMKTISKIVAGLLLMACYSPVFAQDARTYQKIEPDKILNLGDEGIFQPVHMTADDKGGIAVYDYGVDNLLLIDTSEQSIKQIGEGLGGGPKQFSNPTGLSYDSYNGHFWLTDPQQARISIWSTEGGLIKSISFQNASSVPVRALPVTGTTYVWQPINYQEDGFELAISDHKVVVEKQLGRIRTQPKHASLLMEGSLAADSSNIFFAGYKSGFIKSFSRATGTVQNIEPIEATPEPDVITRELDIERMKNVRGTRLNEASVYATLDMEVHQGKLFVLFSGSKTGMAKTIDVYNTRNGRYEFSYALEDHHILKFDIARDRIFAISNIDGENYLVEFSVYSE